MNTHFNSMEDEGVVGEALVKAAQILSQACFHGWPLEYISILMVSLAKQYKDAGDEAAYQIIAEILYITVTGGDTEH